MSCKRPILHQHTKFRKDRSNRWEMSRFCDFPDGGCRHLEFSKIRNFNGISGVGGQYASSRQISSKSVKRLQRYGDLTVFKMAAVRHLGFAKLRIHRDFCDFQHGGWRHLEFPKIRNFNDLSAVGGQYASSYQISSKSVKRLQRCMYDDLTVLKMAAVCHLGFVKFKFFNGRSG